MRVTPRSTTAMHVVYFVIFTAILVPNIAAQSGNSLGIREGAADFLDAYGTDVLVDFPATYSSGQYELSWYQFVEPMVDTIQQTIISQVSLTNDLATGLNVITDAAGTGLGTPNGDTNQIAAQWDIEVFGPPFKIPGSSEIAIKIGEWAQHVVTIDLDADTFSYTYDGVNLVPAGTRWDNPNSRGPALAGMELGIGLAAPDANKNGIDAHVRVDDFMLKDGAGNVLWSEDFENGLGSFVDFPGQVPPSICDADGVCVPLASAAVDLNTLVEAVRTGDQSSEFDITNDQRVDLDDLHEFVTGPDHLNTYLGDANLNGEFNFDDLILVFVGGEYEDAIEDNSTWATGDWNADGDATFEDLVDAMAGGGYDQGPRIAAAQVPEPAGWLPLWIAMWGCRVWRGRR